MSKSYIKRKTLKKSNLQSLAVIAFASIATACGGGGGGGGDSQESIVNESNTAPVAVDDSDSTNEDVALTINASNLLINDSDIDGDTPSIDSFTQPTNGTVIDNGDDTFTYAPDSNFNGNDSFAYTISDGNGGSDTATVSLTVNPINDVPSATDDSASTDEDMDLVLNASDLLSNDSDPDLDILSISSFTEPTNGGLVDNGDDTFTYAPDSNFNGNDSFTYTISDGNGGSDTATVNITVDSINDLPVITTGEPLSSIAAEVEYSFDVDATDIETSGLTYSLDGAPSWLDIDGDGVMFGTPTDVDAGTTAGITVNVSDGVDTVTSATFSVTVLGGFNEALYAVPSVSVSDNDNLRRPYQANDGILPTATLTADSDDRNGWVAGDVAESSIQLDFDSTKSIYRIELNDVANASQVTSGRIIFSDGTEIVIDEALPDDGSTQRFVFEPEETDFIRIVINGNGLYGLAEVGAFSALDPGQVEVARDLFNDGNAAGWTPVENCTAPQGASGDWDGSFSFFTSSRGDEDNQYRQTGACGGVYDEGFTRDTYSVLDTVSPTELDLRVAVRGDDTGADFADGGIGVVFGYQDNDNYYRLELNRGEGHTKLLKREGPTDEGVFTELANDTLSYDFGGWTGLPNDNAFNAVGAPSPLAEGWVNLRVVHKNGVIQAFADGELILSAQDATFTGGRIGLLCANNDSCIFDDVVVLSGTSTPIVGLGVRDSDITSHVSNGQFVSTGDLITVEAFVTENDGFDNVEFVLDEGSSTFPTRSMEDDSAPFSVDFANLPKGDHTVTAYLRDASDNRIVGQTSSHSLDNLGSDGMHIVALGDSITMGLFDEVFDDDTSNDGRNTSGGYPPILNNLLSTANSMPVTIINEGIPGEPAIDAVGRINDVLERNPEAEVFLVSYGANDSTEIFGSPVPTGLGIPLDMLDTTTFKGAIQGIINAVTAEGKQIYLSLAPPFMGPAVPLADIDGDGTLETRDQIIDAYNDVILELVSDNVLITAPPANFHLHFTNNTDQFADDLHPNGQGYQEMARIWCEETLNGQNGIICP